MTSLKKGLQLLLLPAAQYLFLRLALRHLLGLRFGFANTTDFDFLVPAPVALFVLVHALEKAAPLKLQFSSTRLFSHLAGVASFLILNVNYTAVSHWSPTTFTTFWFLTLGWAMLSSLFVFLPPKQLLSHPNRIAIFPCILIACSLYLYSTSFRIVWLLVGEMTASFLHGLFQIFSFLGVTAYYTAEEAVRIDHSLLSIRIARGCGGGDGFFYFVLAFLLVSLTSPLAVRVGRWITSLLAGLAFMFLLNSLRIVVLYFFGIVLIKTLGYETGVKIFKTLFHVHVGWVLYSVGIFFFIRRVYSFSFHEVTSTPTVPSLGSSVPSDAH